MAPPLKIWEKELNMNKNLFFWSSPKSGRKNGLNLSEDLFFQVFTSLEFCSGFYPPFPASWLRACPPPPPPFENLAYLTVSSQE